MFVQVCFPHTHTQKLDCLGVPKGIGAIAAKQNGMKKSKTIPALNLRSGAFVVPPAYPKLATEVIRQLKKGMDQAEYPPGHKLTLKRFGLLIGAPRSTIHDWYYGNLPAPINYFLCAMERLPEIQRTGLLRQLCRDCPRLLHPRLSHDAHAVNALRGLLAQPAGLTFVVGATDATRTFLITAFGNSAGQFIPIRTVCGLDLHQPDSFVPVSGVRYWRNPPGDTGNAQPLVRELWKDILNSTADLLLFNGLWSLMPELRSDIIELARHRLVIVADKLDSRGLMAYATKGLPINIVTTSAEPGGRIRVQVSTETLIGL